jgi:ribosomal protein S18 acetylase RimI-like enzyme
MEVSLHPAITLATVADLHALISISRQTFTESYAHVNTAENMENYLQANFSEHALMVQLAEQGTAFYLVNFGDTTIGYIKLNSGNAQTELKAANALEIERIYVLKEFQNRGIGKLLLDKTLAVAKHMRADYVWLGVWEQNKNAIGFYNRMGFVEFDRHIFMLGNDKQMDLMMKLELSPL